MILLSLFYVPVINKQKYKQKYNLDQQDIQRKRKKIYKHYKLLEKERREGKTNMKNYYITEITVPPPPSSSSSSSYNVETTNSDISILKLAETLVFTWRVSPICLTPPDLTFYKEIVTVIGWGRRFEDDNRRPTVLRDVNLKGKLINFYLPLSNVTLTFFF